MARTAGPLFGVSLGDVELDASPSADKQARTLGAAAFTEGRRIGFRAGRLDPQSASGRRLVAHELAHVVQQRAGADQPHQARPPGPAMEREADTAADRVLSGSQAPALTPTRRGLQQSPEPESPEPTALTGWLAEVERSSPGQLELSAILLPFLAGFFSGLSELSLSEEDQARLMEELTSPESYLAFGSGVNFGILEGASRCLCNNVAGLAKLAWWLLMNTNFFSMTSLVVRHALGEETEVTKLGQHLAGADSMIEAALSAVANELANDPAFLLLAADELGQAAGELVATELEQDFFGAGPHDRGRYYGYGVGYITMEIGLLFIGVGEVVALAKGVSTLAKTSRVGRRILLALSRVEVLRPLLQRAGWLDESGGVVKALPDRGANAADDVGAGAQAGASGSGATVRTLDNGARLTTYPNGRRLLCVNPCAELSDHLGLTDLDLTRIARPQLLELVQLVRREDANIAQLKELVSNLVSHRRDDAEGAARDIALLARSRPLGPVAELGVPGVREMFVGTSLRPSYLSHQSLMNFLVRIWRTRNEVIPDAILLELIDGRPPHMAVYSRYSEALHPNPLIRMRNDQYLNDVVSIASGRKAGPYLKQELPRGALQNVPEGLTHDIQIWNRHGLLNHENFGENFVHFYRTRPDQSPGKEHLTKRIYLDLYADSAPGVMKDIVSKVVDDAGNYPQVVGAKMASSEWVTTRSESGLIYLHDEAVPDVLTFLENYQVENWSAFRPSAPPMTRPVMRGVSLGSEPMSSPSFGTLRARAILEALESSSRHDTLDDFIDRCLETLWKRGVDPGEPDRNLVEWWSRPSEP